VKWNSIKAANLIGVWFLEGLAPDAGVYINGVLALQTSGYITSCDAFPLTPEGLAALKPGKNLIARDCPKPPAANMWIWDL
jgi:hypothetical protein